MVQLHEPRKGEQYEFRIKQPNRGTEGTDY